MVAKKSIGSTGQQSEVNYDKMLTKSLQFIRNHEKKK